MFYLAFIAMLGIIGLQHWAISKDIKEDGYFSSIFIIALTILGFFSCGLLLFVGLTL